MIHKEEVLINNEKFKKTYSDTYKIKKVGTAEIYEEALDIITSEYEYEETEELREGQ